MRLVFAGALLWAASGEEERGGSLNAGETFKVVWAWLHHKGGGGGGGTNSHI